MEILKIRKVVNPILVVTGVVVMVSGVCMFFHFQSHTMVEIHEILGLTFVVLSVIHIVLNWQALLKTIDGFPMRMITLVLIVGLVTWMIVSAATFARGGPGHGSGEGPHRKQRGEAIQPQRHETRSEPIAQPQK
ncbi:MAG: DUF4405 domain-containing protein [Phycisphaerae bacterium]|nr:DUF4405 domain-containing protein [Phycisphaerae bacterium]